MIEWHRDLEIYREYHDYLKSKGARFEISGYGNLSKPYSGLRTRVRMHVIFGRIPSTEEIRQIDNMLHSHPPDKEYTLFAWVEGTLFELRPQYLSLSAKNAGDRSLITFPKCRRLAIGYVARDQLLLELDGPTPYHLLAPNRTNLIEINQRGLTFKYARRIANIVMESWPEVGDCLIVRSSARHYHLVFDAILQWHKIERIIQALGILSILQSKYVYYRMLTRNTVLRISEKVTENAIKDAPIPVSIEQNNSKNNFDTLSEQGIAGIARYLLFLSAYRRVELPSLVN